ncbi:MAG TPA: glycosyltransferase, partial [Ktedonobacterales bacterium]
MAHEPMTAPVAAAPRASRLRGVLAALVPALHVAVRWLFLLLIAVLPVDAYLTLPGASSGVFLSQVLAMEACGLLALLLLLGRVLRVGGPFSLHARDLLPLGAVLLVGLLSLVGAQSISVGARACAQYAFLIAVFALALSVRHVPGIRHAALAGVVLGYCLVLVFGLLGTIPGMPDLPKILLNLQQVQATLPHSGTLRATSTFRFTDELNGYLLLVLPILLVCAIKVTSWAERLAYALLVLLGLLLLVLTYTRSAFLIFLFIPPVLLYFLGYRKFALLGVFGGAFIGLTALLVDANASARLFSLLSTSDVGYTNRLATWRWALNAFLHHPVLGVGPRNLQFQPGAPFANPYLHQLEDNAENSYLNVLADLGLMGLACLVTCIYAAARRMWRGLRQGGDWLDQSWHVGLLTGFVALLLDSLVHPTFSGSQITGLLCALVGLAGTLPNVGPASPAASWSVRMAELIARARAQGGVAQGGVAQGALGLPLGLHSRVVFLVNAGGMGGAQRHSLNLAAELRRRGTHVLVVVPPDSPLIPLLREQAIPYRALSLGLNIGRMRGFAGTALFFSPGSRGRTYRQLLAIAAEEPSIFVCPFLREQLLATRLGQRVGFPVVWVLHNPLVFWPHRVLLQGMWCRLARKADGLMTVAPSLVGQVRGIGFPTERLSVIPNAVPDALVAEGDEVERVPGMIVAVTRLVKTKGIQQLISALPRVLERHPTAHLVIAGDGRYEPALRALARRLGVEWHVEFRGAVAQPAALMRQASLFVCPSDRDEVLPTVILEALGVGTPVIAKPLASIPEVVIPDQTGVLVPPGDAAALAEAISALLDDPARARALGAGGRELVRANYTFGTTGAKFHRLLTEIETAELEEEALSTSATLRAVQRPRLLGGTALLTASKVLVALGTALWTILAARALLPAAYGNLMLVTGLVELGAIITDAGFSTVATRELAKAHDDAEARLLTSTLLYLKLGLGVLATVVTIGVTLLIPFSDDARRLMLVLGPGLIFIALNSLTLVFRARLQFSAVLGIALISALLSGYTAVVVARLFPTDTAFAQARLLVVVVGGVVTVAMLFATLRPGLAFSPRLARGLLGAAISFGVAQALTILYVRIDVPIIALLAGETQVAVYTSAYRILDVITLLPVSAAGVALPLMAAMSQRKRSYLRTFAQQYLELAVVGGMLVVLGVLLFGDPVLQLLYGGRYAAAGPVLRVLGVASGAMFVTNVFAPLAAVLDRRRTVLFATMFGLVVNVGLNLLLIPRMGPTGSAWATLVTELAVTLPLAWVCVRALDWRVDAYTLVAALEATVFALLAAWLLRQHPAWQADSAAFGVWLVALVVLAPGWFMGLVRSLWRGGPRGPVVSRARPSMPPGALSG